MLKKIHELGFNIIPVSKNKIPAISWQKYQVDRSLQADEYTVNTGHWGIVTGYNNLEVIDVDLKVIFDKKEKEEFKHELLETLADNVPSFDELVIVETQTKGLHILYQCKEIEGNKKLAYHEDSKEALIETRGIGGYVFYYENFQQNDYTDITEIPEKDRNTIIAICKSFSHVKPVHHEPTIQEKRKFIPNDRGLTPWDDYNNKTNVLDLLSLEFKVVGHNDRKIKIRRNGAKSPHSGYVYQDSGCMYLFSTGTQYPNEALLSPFAVYTIQNHNGDFKQAASDLYMQGYGDRHKPTAPDLPKIKLKDDKPEPKKDTQFPLHIFPEEIKTYMQECSYKLNNSPDYMGAAFVWLSSLIIGNALRIEIKKGWQEIPTVWIAIVGEAGIGKTPSVSSITAPLEKINGTMKKQYSKDKKAYEDYKLLSKEKKRYAPEVEEPRRQQFIVDDVTIEALINLHAENPNGVGILKDELAGWFKDMNKYKEGSDKEQWLSSWSGKGISVDRITRQSDYIERPILPVLGGIQPSILHSFFTDDNKDSGFLDRMLFSYPELSVQKYNEAEIEQSQIEYYSDWVKVFREEIRRVTNLNHEGEVMPIIARWDPQAKKHWIKVFNEITEKQESEETPEFIKPLLSKMKSYIGRFALIINTIKCVHNGLDLQIITEESVQHAYELANYFIDMNTKLIYKNMTLGELKSKVKETRGTIEEKIKAVYDADPKFNKSTLAKELNVSRKTIYKYIKALKEQGE